MEFSIGFVGRDFVLLAADTASARSIVVFKQGRSRNIFVGAIYSVFYCSKPLAVLSVNNEVKFFIT